MLATAIKLQEASRDAVHDEMMMVCVKHILDIRNEVNDEEFIKELYQYSALLASLTTSLVTSVLLTESELNDMLSTINEIESMEDIVNGND